MKKQLAVFIAALSTLPAWALGTVNYNTTGSLLQCNGVAGCVANTSTQVTVGGITLTYNTGSGSGVQTPSYINLGNFVTTGTGSNVNLTGLKFTLNVNSTPPGVSGALPFGLFNGTIGTSQSLATFSFSSNNTTTAFGTLPGVVDTYLGETFAYQALTGSPLVLQAPTVGNPIGQTGIQGVVALTTAVPEPTSGWLMGSGLAVLAFLGTRRRNAG